ncbi:hypothetical protein HanHA300_Chr09g0321141 [Helianthus annuus]|nr:hypothetical protein HanHA300_Chr09g0321141 [Helianthus annuus]
MLNLLNKRRLNNWDTHTHGLTSPDTYQVTYYNDCVASTTSFTVSIRSLFEKCFPFMREQGINNS